MASVQSQQPYPNETSSKCLRRRRSNLQKNHHTNWKFVSVIRASLALLSLQILLHQLADDVCHPSSSSCGSSRTIFIVHAETEIKWTPAEEPQQQDAGSSSLSSPTAPGGVPAAGPLPLSQKQRQQLLQLGQAIQNSPNPEQTLIQAAQANQMDPNDLLSLLERNRQDMINAGGGGAGGMSRPTNVILNALSSLCAVIVHFATKHPKQFALIFMSLFFILYMGIETPRTGLVLSTHRSFLISKGPSTVFNPPTSFVQRKFLDDDAGMLPRIHRRRHGAAGDGDSSDSYGNLWRQVTPLLIMQEEEEEEHDDARNGGKGVGTTSSPLSAARNGVWFTSSQLRKNDADDVQAAATAYVTLRPSDFLPSTTTSSASTATTTAVKGPTTPRRKVKEEGSTDDEESEVQDEEEDDMKLDLDGEDEDEGANNEIDEIMDMLLDHASDVVMKSRKLTELVPTDRGSIVKLVVPETTSKRQNKNAVLVVSRMGDYKRFGLLPLRVTDQIETDRHMSLTFETFEGLGHFDGQINISVSRHNNQKARNGKDSRLKIRVVLVVPKKSKSISKMIALEIVECLCQSIKASITTRTKQSLARRSQSARFQGTARQNALRRRKTRFNKERAMEEMAADRRRRWQRTHQNSGSYRPSGDRMRSPNNAVYR